MDAAKTPRAWWGPARLWLAPALLLAAGVLLILSGGLGIEAGLSNRLFDSYQRHAARPFADLPGMPVRVLELPALEEDRLVEIARLLAGQGARMIVLTAPVEPGPSPQSLSARLPPGSDVARAALARLPEPGHELAAAIVGIKGILPVMLGESGRAPHLKARFVYRGTRNPFGQVPVFAAAAAPSAVLQANAAGLAAPNLIPDADGTVRRLAVAFRADSQLVPAMPAEVLRLAGAKKQITVVSDEHDPLSFFSGIGIGGLQTDSGLLPTDSHGRVRLRYAADPSARLLDPAALLARPLKDAIVVIGVNGHVVKTPLGTASLAGVVGEAIEDFAGGTVLVRPSWGSLVEALQLAVAGAAMTLLLRFGLGWAAMLAMSASVLSGLGSWYLYTAQGLLLDAATPALFLGLAFSAATLAWLQRAHFARVRLRMAFSDWLPRSTLERIAHRPQLLRTDGEWRTLTYLDCAIGGLVPPAGNDAAAFSGVLEKVLAPLIDQVLAHGGTVAWVSGDGFAAYWNAPLDDADHALHACKAATAMAAWAAGQSALTIGVGIATGAAIAGGIGGHDRLGYGVHGDVVALARKIRALSDHHAAPLIVAEETRRLAERDCAFLEIDAVAERGKGPPTVLYALMGGLAVRASPKFRALTVFHDHIFRSIRKQNWEMARALIAQCRRLSGANQKLYDLHLARIAYYEKNPPGPDWDGAFRPVLE